MNKIKQPNPNVKPAKNVLVGFRVSSAQLRVWEAVNVKNGQERSAVMRKMLGLGKPGEVPAARPKLTVEEACVYYRAMRIRESALKIALVLKDAMKFESVQVSPAFSEAIDLVQMLVNEIGDETTELQRLSGEFEEPQAANKLWRDPVCT
jgi:hypothetical protein